jgi:hypothetical protein
MVFFTGTIKFAPWKQTGSLGPPLLQIPFLDCWPTCKTTAFPPYSLSLVIRLMKWHNITWLLACLQGKFGLLFFVIGLLPLAPQQEDSHFSSWWSKTIKADPKEIKKGLNSPIIIVAWEIWKDMNQFVFEGGSPCFQKVLLVAHECNLWC